MRCKWLSDDFSEICVNGDCPVCGDWCVCANYPEICRYAEEGADAKGAWISVKDRLPTSMGWYLVFYKGNDTCNEDNMQVAFFKGKTWPFNNHYHTITHWMPLPEAPKEG